MRTNLHIYPSPFKNESRILKEIQSILELGLSDEIIIAATWAQGLKEVENLSNNITVVRIKTIFDRLPKILIIDILRFIAYNIKAYNLFKKNENIAHINCHSLSVLATGYFLKKKQKKILIYDAHELETERAGLRGIKQQLSKILEKKLINYCDYVIVVGEMIAQWYRDAYKRNDIYVIRNIPSKKIQLSATNDVFRKKWNIPNSHTIFIYQGMIRFGRGIEILLNTFKKLSHNNHLVIMGYGNQEEQVKEVAIKYANIHFHPAVHPFDIPRYTACADVGIHIPENVGISYYLSLPNKFFEYLYCGLPVIVSNFPEMSAIVKKEDCGWMIEPNITELTKLVGRLTKDEVNVKKTKLKDFSSRYNWEQDAEILKTIFLT